ncbi:MAG: hypothetical protein ABW201_05035 [Candidatus Thiodiazotropha sp.]
MIKVHEAHIPALLGLDRFDAVWALYWFDRNDTPRQRRILQVHPNDDPDKSHKCHCAVKGKSGLLRGDAVRYWLA